MEATFESLIKLSKPKGKTYHSDGAVLLNAEESAYVHFCGCDIAYNSENRYAIRIVGESDVPIERRTECGFTDYYKILNESLVEEGGALILTADFDNEPYNRTVYNFIKKPGICDGDKLGLSTEICVSKRSENNKSKISVSADVYYRDASGRRKFYFEKPDQRIRIDLRTAGEDWTSFTKAIRIRGDVDYIMLRFDVKNFCGSIKLRAPILYANGRRITGDFVCTSDKIFEGKDDDTFEWFGDGFSRIEHPEFEITVNDANSFVFKPYQAYYRYPAYRFPLPNGVLTDGENTIRVKFNGPSPIPFKIKAIDLISEKNGLRFISCPKTPALNVSCCAVIETSKDGQTVVVNASSQIKIEKEKMYCRRAGLHFIHFTPISEGVDLKLTISSGNETDTADIERVVVKGSDGVLTGTGDQIFINQKIEDFTYFFKWYVASEIANVMTFRTTYERGGNSYADKKAWLEMTRLCESAGLFYAHMVDGRTLNGADANPKVSWMKGKRFLGFQAHERGAYAYLGERHPTPEELVYRKEEKFRTAFSRKTRRPGQQHHKVPTYIPDVATDMRCGVENFLNDIRPLTEYITRETDPSVLPKYFLQAGFSWVGIETMYIPHNTVIGALRGATKAYKKDDFGTHLAMQWGSSPLECEPHYRRYLVELYLSYINGATEINTEEGLWRFDNWASGGTEAEHFDTACVEHTKMQQRFYKYINTHTRRGKLHTPIAALHGRYDPWTCFLRLHSWQQPGEKWQFAESEESWDLLNVFYPKEKLDAIYCHPAPVEPLGYYSQSVFGVIDILPVEATGDIYNTYSCLFFLGYNTMDDDIAEKLYAFVENGGRLILSRAHLSTSLIKSEVVNGTSECFQSEHISMLTAGESGKPHRVGKGEVVFFDTQHFPAATDLRSEYENALNQAGEYVTSLEREKGYAGGGENITFTVYDDGENRYIYFVNVNWWEAKTETAPIYFGEREFEIAVNPEYIGKAFIYKDICLYVNDGHSEILSITENLDGGYTVCIQGGGIAEIHIFRKNGRVNYRKMTLFGIDSFEV